MSLKAISVKVGDRVTFLGAGIRRADGKESLTRGDVGRVIEVRAPRRGVGSVIDTDGEEINDADRCGLALVEWPRYRASLIHADTEGERWEISASRDSPCEHTTDAIPHTCPYRLELYDDHSACLCCVSCTNACAADI
jgi:hypothetical protein